MLDREKPFIFTIPDVLDERECEGLIARIDDAEPALAPISTPLGAVVRTGVRNNERVMFEDRDLAALLFARVAPHTPAEIFGRRLVGANELLRCYRYRPGTRFAPHSDGAFERNADEQSYYTLLVYLNEGFAGGATTFLVEPEVRIKPKRGLACLFQHPIIHEGSMVKAGTKYVVRSDLMYRNPAA